ncbi:MAG: DUF4239 domain-containing protein [Magnetospirillum sp. WYHS-4]
MNASVDLAYDVLPLLDTLLLWVASQPVWLGMATVVGGTMLISLVGAAFVGHVTDPLVLADNNLVSGAKYQFLSEVYAALLAFVLIAAAFRYTDARTQVQTEATALRLFDSTIAQLANPQVPEIRGLVRTYVINVVENEFITMQLGRESLGARAAFQRLLGGYAKLENVDEHERLTRLQADQFLADAMDSRQQRLASVRPKLRTLIWGVLLFSSLLSIMFNWFFAGPSFLAHVAMAMLLAAGIATIVYMTLLLYHPFTGALAISPRPFEYLLPAGHGG